MLAWRIGEAEIAGRHRCRCSLGRITLMRTNLVLAIAIVDRLLPVYLRQIPAIILLLIFHH
jgi:hypothetical protein